MADLKKINHLTHSWTLYCKRSWGQAPQIKVVSWCVSAKRLVAAWPCYLEKNPDLFPRPKFWCIHPCSEIETKINGGIFLLAWYLKKISAKHPTLLYCIRLWRSPPCPPVQKSLCPSFPRPKFWSLVKTGSYTCSGNLPTKINCLASVCNRPKGNPLNPVGPCCIVYLLLPPTPNPAETKHQTVSAWPCYFRRKIHDLFPRQQGMFV